MRKYKYCPGYKLVIEAQRKADLAAYALASILEQKDKPETWNDFEFWVRKSRRDVFAAVHFLDEATDKLILWRRNQNQKK